MQERNDIGDAMTRRQFVFYVFTSRWTTFHHERPYLWFRQFVKKNGGSDTSDSMIFGIPRLQF
ncbi:hypothetical protein [Paenibacillus foliorum]|uniref:hypothetical protein n=1 Tax=Paenibacillus foliorum TaxID=2654974 RepID=UPI001FE3CDA5|nr:hypothetical protein [Paenibacillus foliorum]